MAQRFFLTVDRGRLAVAVLTFHPPSLFFPYSPLSLSLLLVVRIKPSMRGFFIRKYTIITRSATAYNKSCIRFFPNGLFVFFLLTAVALLLCFFLWNKSKTSEGWRKAGIRDSSHRWVTSKITRWEFVKKKKSIIGWVKANATFIAFHRFFFLHRRH